jgi:hypothetical protein
MEDPSQHREDRAPSSRGGGGRVDPSDGIDKDEARIIAGLKRAGDQWLVTPHFGYAAEPADDAIVIDARTGGVRYRDWPSFETSDDLLADPRTAALVQRRAD